MGEASAPSSTPVQPGDLLAEKYRVERVLGQGGMGIVVAATHLQLDERVAIKFLLPESLQNEEVKVRFLREARAAVKIKSEHVARVSDVGTLANGAPYLVMEYLDGKDLAALLEERGSFAVEEAVADVLQAAEAVAEAHAAGIVHRDLKPANLFLANRPDGRRIIKVLDFGISKSTTGDPSLTSTGALLGSPYYMSPEQMTAVRSVDGRADIWAFGVILYELLCGRTPFGGETVAEVILNVANVSPSPPRTFRPDLPPELEGVILRCLRKAPRERYADVGEFARALEPFGGEGGAQSITRIVGVLSGGTSLRPSRGSAPDATPRTSGPGATGSAATVGAAATLAAWSPATTGTPSGRSRAIWAAVAIAGLALGGGVFAFMRTSKPVDATQVVQGTPSPVMTQGPSTALSASSAPASASPVSSVASPEIPVPSSLSVPSAIPVKVSAGARPDPGAAQKRPPSGTAAHASAAPASPSSAAVAKPDKNPLNFDLK